MKDYLTMKIPVEYFFAILCYHCVEFGQFNDSIKSVCPICLGDGGKPIPITELL